MLPLLRHVSETSVEYIHDEPLSERKVSLLLFLLERSLLRIVKVQETKISFPSASSGEHRLPEKEQPLMRSFKR